MHIIGGDGSRRNIYTHSRSGTKAYEKGPGPPVPADTDSALFLSRLGQDQLFGRCLWIDQYNALVRLLHRSAGDKYCRSQIHVNDAANYLGRSVNQGADE